MTDAVTDAIRPVTFVQTGRVQEIAFETGMSIAQAFKAINVSIGRGQEIRLNNQPIRDQDTALNPGDQLMVIGNVSGG